MEPTNRIADLIFMYQTGTFSEAEEAELMEWVNASTDNRLLFERLTDPARMGSFLRSREKILDMMYGKYSKESKVISMRGWQRYAAAAVLILVALGLALRYLNADRPIKNELQEQAIANDAAPGNFAALLKLADGKKIILDSAGLGLLAQQGTTSIFNKDGQLTYDASDKKNTEVLYNSLETATGQTYALTLSDGTKVWLNSKSLLRFPVSFTGSERNVEMQGEVYFEVAKNAKMPFKVKVVNPTSEPSLVEVLGTHFNINAYDDEPMAKTTLIEGSVRVSGASGNRKQLTPGQQSLIDNKGAIVVANSVNVEAVTAWKNQTFYFESFDLKVVMRQLSRWYGIEVKYDGNIPEMTLSGMIGRNRNLSDVLKALELNGVKFKMVGKTVTVLP